MFWIMHIAAVFVFPLALFVTIPLHVMYAGSKGRGK